MDEVELICFQLKGMFVCISLAFAWSLLYITLKTKNGTMGNKIMSIEIVFGLNFLIPLF
jgi:hypothetical protein